MPDRTVALVESDPIPFKAHDNGDGTFSLATSATAGGARGSFTDHSGVTPDAATHQVAAANAGRNYLIFQNNHATLDLWINFGVAAVIGQPSILVQHLTGLTWENSFIPTDALNVIGSGAGITYTCKEG